MSQVLCCTHMVQPDGSPETFCSALQQCCRHRAVSLARQQSMHRADHTYTEAAEKESRALLSMSVANSHYTMQCLPSP